MQSNMPENIVIGGKEYPVSQFSDNVKTLVILYTNWKSDLAKERIAVMKTEAAIKSIETELAILVQAQLADKEVAATDQESASAPDNAA